MRMAETGCLNYPLLFRLLREPGCTLTKHGRGGALQVCGVWGCRPFLKLLPDALAGGARSAHSCLVGHTLQEGAQCV